MAAEKVTYSADTFEGVTFLIKLRQKGTMTSNDNDISSIARVLAGETDVFSELVERHGGMVFSLVCQIVKSREDAEELTQDVFVKAFGALKKYNGQSSFSTWIYRIGYNTAVSFMRRKREKTIDVDEARIKDADDDFIETGFARDAENSRYDKLKGALDLLCAEERAVVSLFYMEDKSIADIAEITGQSVANVKVRLHRTRRKMFVLMNG